MSKDATTLLPEGVTQDQVNAWKELYGSDKLKLANLKKDEAGNQLKVIAHSPTRTVIGEFEKWSDTNPDKAKEILIKGCMLTGIEEITKPGNDLLFLSAFNACSKLMPKAESEILNL